MIDKIVELNAEMPEEVLEEILGQKIAMVRSKREASLAELEGKFNERISLFINKILSFSFRWNDGEIKDFKRKDWKQYNI